MTTKRFSLTALLLLAAAALALPPATLAAEKPYALDEVLPVDPAVIVGRLDNGLTYYVRENPTPEGRASLRLVVKAGSLQEEDDQRGLAHFVEHMAFNGTERFSQKELVDFFERIGMRFGSHVNAYTGFEETVYRLDAPMDREGAFDTGLLVLEDWAGGIVFDPAEVEAERRIIEEEWRSRRGAQQRLLDKQYPAIYYNSRFAERIPIGSMVVVRNAPRQRLIDFYEDWYRPELMAVIAVGDFEAAEVEEKIRLTFAELENPPDAPELAAYPVPDHEETVVSIQSDTELTVPSLQVLRKRDAPPEATTRGYFNLLAERMYLSMVNRRLEERSREANPPLLGASVGLTKLSREREAFAMSALLKQGGLEEGLQAILGEVNRARRYGFGQAEFERTKANMLSDMERLYNERGKSDSSLYAAEYTRNFLEGEPIPGIEVEFELLQQFLDQATVERINAEAREMASLGSQVALYSAPELPGWTLPSKKELLAAIERAEQVELEPYEDLALDQPLLEELPESGAIEREIRHEAVGVREWRLSNGVRVVWKKTDFKNDEVLTTAFSPGGHSLAAPDEFVSAAYASTIIDQSGAGDYSAADIEKILAGESVSISSYINSQYEGIEGSFSPDDWEAWFQLLYLRMTRPRLDRDVFASFLSRQQAVVRNRKLSPDSLFRDAIEQALYGEHPRHRPMSEELLDELDPELALAVYENRFADFSDFTFVFVGAIEESELRQAAERYLAALPSLGREESGRHTGDDRVPGRKEVLVRKGLEEKSSVRLIFHGEAEWSPARRYAQQAMLETLRLRLRESLRESVGGTYSVGVFGNLAREPVERYATGVAFVSDPARVEGLVDLALQEIGKLRQSGPTEDEVERVRELQRREYEEAIRSNGYWLGSLARLAKEGRDLEEILDYPKRIENLDAETIRMAARAFTDEENMLLAILDPELE